MKQKIIDAFFFFLFLIVTVVAVYLGKTNEELNYEIEKIKELNTESKVRDSLYYKKLTENTKKFDSYYTDSSILVNGKKITNSQVVNLFYEYSNKADSLNGIISNLKSALELADKNYGVKYKIVSKGNSTYISMDSPKLDSALIIFERYKHKLVRDSTNKNIWRIKQ
jgi:hypothetical protein